MDRCATAYILLAEEEATTIAEAEKLFKQALKAGDGCYRRSQQLQHHGSQYEAQHSKVSPAGCPGEWGWYNGARAKAHSSTERILVDRALRPQSTWLPSRSHSLFYLCPQSFIAVNKQQSPFKQFFEIIIQSFHPLPFLLPNSPMYLPPQ